jgi:hypothetical protein
MNIRILTIAAITMLSACAASAPLSFLEGRPYHRTNPLRYPVRVISVDGDFSVQRSRPVYAGMHTLIVETAPVAGFRTAGQQAIPFKVQPCTRYYLAAERATSLSQDWQLVVDETGPVAGCNPEEEIAKSASERIPPGDVGPSKDLK